MVDVWLLSGQKKARLRSNTDDLMSIDQTKTVITEEADKLMVCEIFKAEPNQQFVNSEREKVGILLVCGEAERKAALVEQHSKAYGLYVTSTQSGRREISFEREKTIVYSCVLKLCYIIKYISYEKRGKTVYCL